MRERPGEEVAEAVLRSGGSSRRIAVIVSAAVGRRKARWPLASS
jgi:hypothetical protein